MENLDFYERYIELKDNEIIDILRRRKDYQENAINAAIKIAIERQLIQNENDLFGPEFQYPGKNPSLLFPLATKEYQRDKIIGSIFRFLYLLSLLPIIFGIMKFVEGEFSFGFIGTLVGIIWFIFSFILSKKRDKLFLYFLLITFFLVSCSVGWNILSQSRVIIVDIFVYLLGVLLTFYMLLFLKKLI